MVLLYCVWQVEMSLAISGHSKRPVPLNVVQLFDELEKSITGSPPTPVVIWNRKAIGIMSMLESVGSLAAVVKAQESSH